MDISGAFQRCCTLRMSFLSEIYYVYDTRYYSKTFLKRLDDCRVNEIMDIENIDRLYFLRDKSEEFVVCIRRKQLDKLTPHVYGKCTFRYDTKKHSISNTIIYTHNPNILWYLFIGEEQQCQDDSKDIIKILRNDGVIINEYINLRTNLINHCKKILLKSEIQSS